MFHAIVKRFGFCAGAVTLPLFLFSSQASVVDSDADHPNFARNRYIGSKACKNCHKTKVKGEQYQKWEKGPHAEAFEVLGTAKAKEIAKKAGVKDPQKDAKCLQCHVTAHGAKKRDVKRGFKVELGVQCESCHGPGENHAKTRFKVASSGKVKGDSHTKIPDDEIVKRPTEKVCLTCHNEKSPTFKPFCFKERRKEVAHLDSRIKRTPEEIKALECKCGEKDKKCECKQCECGGYETGGVKKVEKK